MSDIAPIGRPNPATITQTGRTAQNDAPTATQNRPSDQVELSTASRLLSRLSELPSVRQGLVDSVRSQISAGTYETPDKLDTAVDNLAQDIGSPS